MTYFNVPFEGHVRQVWPWTLLFLGPLFQNIRIRIKLLSYFFYILYIVLLPNDHLWSVLNIQLFINECHCNIFSIVKMSFTLSELFTWLNMVFLFNVSTINNTYHLIHYNKHIYTKTFKLLSELAKKKNSVWYWVRQELGFCLTHGLCVCPTIFL